MSNFYQQSGYSQAAIGYAIALHKAGINVAIRSIDLDNVSLQESLSRRLEAPELIRELESKDLRNVDYIIHHTLPHLASPSNRAKNILAFAVETSNLRQSNWPAYCNSSQFSSVMTFCKQSVLSIKDSGVSKPIHNVPHALDLEAAKNPNLQQILDPSLCNFVFIGEWGVRKNTTGLLKSYFATFSQDEKVALVLKTFVSGLNPEQSLQHIKSDIERIRKDGNLKSYPYVYIITEKFSPFRMQCLMKSATYSVNTSFSESFGLPVFESLAYGVPFIAPNSWAFKEYLNKDAGFLINTAPDFMYGVHNGFPDVYNCRSIWDRPNLVHLKSIFREAFDAWRHNNDKTQQKYVKLSQASLQLAQRFSYEKIGQQLRSVI